MTERPTLERIKDELLEALGLPPGFKGDLILHVTPARDTKPEVRYFPDVANQQKSA